MSTDPQRTHPQPAADAVCVQRRTPPWRRDPWAEPGPPKGWRLVFPGVFLVYLVQTASGVDKYSHGAAAVAGYVIIGAFCACYLYSLQVFEPGTGPEYRFWALFAAQAALFVVELFFARSDASVMLVYLTVLSVAALYERALPLVVLFALAALLLPEVVPSWHTGANYGTGAAVALVGLAMFGFFGIIRQHAALRAARAEVERLAADSERNRIARDLHDLLGHSLTTITVKAGLARRLAASDPERASQEITEVERLGRRALTDVRAAVSGYRDLSLARELATGGELLRASGVAADLPRATDVVDPSHQELFAWVLREGVTNIVRHARATSCRVEVGPGWIEIADDGRGAPGTAGVGNGLAGLRERLAAAGGTLEAGPVAAGGWRLRAEVPAPADRPGGRPAAVPVPG